MCCIMVSDKERPTEVMVRKAWSDNDDGGGAAWREDEAVHWKKGLKLDDMVHMAEELPMPFVLHFRRNSVGGVRPSLTHPFPIDQAGNNFLNGKTNGLVLFHNGHWNDWKKTMFEAVVKFGKEIPKGKWSDTRAMAWLTSLYGIGFLDLLDEKTVAFGPKTIDTCLGTGWKEINGVLCSNDYFMNKYIGGSEKCKVQGCHVISGLVDGWCFTHRPKIVDNTGRRVQGFPNTGIQPPTDTRTTKSDISRPDAKKVEVKTKFDDEDLGGSSTLVPFASLRAAEELFSEGRKVSKKFINRARFSYQRVFDLPSMRLTPQQRQLLAQCSPTILIKASQTV